MNRTLTKKPYETAGPSDIPFFAGNCESQPKVRHDINNGDNANGQEPDSSERHIPPETQRKLNNPPAAGQGLRHEWVLSVTMALVGEQWNEEEIVELLKPKTNSAKPGMRPLGG